MKLISTLGCLVLVFGTLACSNGNNLQAPAKRAAEAEKDEPNSANEEEVKEEETVEEVEKPEPKKLVDASVNGEFQFEFYDQGLESEAYESARVYYPVATEKNPGPFPATTTSGGFTNVKEDMYWLSERLASHGFIVIVFTPTNNNSLNPEIWSTGHKGGLQKLEQENNNQESAIFGKVDLNLLAVSGFSMGGAGTILAANELGDKVKVAAPFNAFRPVDSTMKAATLFIAGTEDTVAVPGNIKESFDSLQGPPKVYANFEGFGHAMTDPGIVEPAVSTHVVSWYQRHLYQNELYDVHLTGTENKEDLDTEVFTEGNYEISLQPAS